MSYNVRYKLCQSIIVTQRQLNKTFKQNPM